MTNEPLKICIIPAWYPTSKNKVDGIFIQDQAEALATFGHHVTVMFISNNYTQSPLGEIKYEKINDVHTYLKANLALPKANTLLIDIWANQYEKLWSKYVDDFGLPDIIHSHSYIGGFAGQLLSEKYQIPFVHTEHSTNFITGDIKNRHQKKIQSLFSEANALISVGQLLKEKMASFCERKIEVIPNLINNSIFNFQTDEIKAKYFLVVGGLEKRKKVDEIIECFSKIDNGYSNGNDNDNDNSNDNSNNSDNNSDKIMLKIIGSGQEERKLNKLIYALGLNEKVLLLGNLSPFEVAEHMRKAMALITNSETETFGKVIIESLACGTPVVCRRSADPENIVKEEFGNKYDNQTELQKIMTEHIQGGFQFDRKTISKQIVKKYGHNTVVNQIENIYTKVLKSVHEE